MTDDGRVLADQALVSDEVRSDLHPTGFDPSREFIDRVVEAVRDVAESRKPRECGFGSPHDTAIHLGLIAECSQTKPCRTCGAARRDWTYWEVTLAGQAYLALAIATETRRAETTGSVEDGARPSPKDRTMTNPTPTDLEELQGAGEDQEAGTTANQMKKVIIESPYAGDIEANTAYARRAMMDSLKRGEAPIASHLLYPQVLDEDKEEEREWGIKAGLEWRKAADLVAFYADRGWSKGMLAAKKVYDKEDRKVVVRFIGHG